MQAQEAIHDRCISVHIMENNMATQKNRSKGFTFGTCAYERTSPPRDNLSTATKVLNIVVPFEEALKLSLAVDECLRRLNSYKMSTIEGKRAAMNLTIYFNLKRIGVNETKTKL